MNPEQWISLVTAAVALSGVWISTRSAKATARLQDELAERREKQSKEQAVEEVMARYREPLLRAAFDLQSRVYNIVKQDFLGKYYLNGRPAEREYAITNSLFVFAEYFAWVEVLRRGVQFLDLGDVERNRCLTERLEAVTLTLGDDQLIPTPAFRLLRGQQRALGEVMVEEMPSGNRDDCGQCLGYATFIERLGKDPPFRRWFEPLRADIEELATDDAGYERLVRMQHDLIDLIDFLDDPPVRFSKAQRTKI